MVDKKQLTFDHIVNFLRNQGKKSESINLFDNFPTCKLRDSDGNKCAIGCCIPDSKYKPILETSSDLYNSIFEPFYDPQFLVNHNNKYDVYKHQLMYYKKPIPLIQIIQDSGFDPIVAIRLQEVHDYHDIDEWEECFKVAAINLGVNYNANI